MSRFDETFIAVLDRSPQGHRWTEEEKKLYDLNLGRDIGPGESSIRKALGLSETLPGTSSTCDLPEINGEVKCVHSYGPRRKDGTRGSSLVPFMVNGKALKTWGNATYYMPEKLRYLPPPELTDAISESRMTREIQDKLPRRYLNFILNRMKPSSVMTSATTFCVSPFGYIAVPQIDYNLAFSFYVMNPGKAKYQMNEDYLLRLAGIAKAT